MKLIKQNFFFNIVPLDCPSVVDRI